MKPLFRLSFTLALLLIISPLVTPCFSQQRWTKTYGGTQDDYGYSVQQTQDGGYIIAGNTKSFGDTLGDVYLIKTNAYGDTLWTRTYGGANTDVGRSVQQTQDGGFIVAGYTLSFGAGGADVWLIKTDVSGDTQWTRTYGGQDYDWGYSVQQTQDGGYIIGGYTGPYGAGLCDFYLIKTNASGDTLWTRTYGGAGDDEGFSVQQTQDGGYIIAGRTSSFGATGYDVWLVRTNVSGDTLWARRYGWPLYDKGYSVKQTQDGGFIITGWTERGGSVWYVCLIKTNPSGDTLWTKTYGGIISGCEGRSVQQTQDGGYIITGRSGSDVYLIKTDVSGDTLWTRTYGGSSTDEGWAVQQTQDGGYIIVGNTFSFGAGGSDVYLIKTDANGNVGVEETRGSRKKAVVSIKATPNPFTSFTTLPGHSSESFALYDISGRRVGIYKGDRIGSDVSQGVYFLRAEGGEDRPLRIVKVR